MPSIALDRFTTTLPDLLNACAFNLYAFDTCPDRGCAAAPLKTNVRKSPMLERAFEAYKVKCRNSGLPVPPFALLALPQALQDDGLEAHYKTCPEIKIECPQGGKDCSGRKNHGWRKRRIMPTHIDEECAQWTCRAVKGCETRTTRANLEKHEEGCSADHEDIKAFAREIQRLRSAVDASTKRCNALEEEKSDLTAKLAGEEKRRANMVTSSTSTDPVELSAATGTSSASTKQGILTPSSRANVDPAGQATKRSSRIAAKRRSSQAFADASDVRPSPSRRGTVKPEPADA
ncbi:hypothetical protein NBRC10513v2_002741 [Rhodotorula toruloides]